MPNIRQLQIHCEIVEKVQILHFPEILAQ